LNIRDEEVINDQSSYVLVESRALENVIDDKISEDRDRVSNKENKEINSTKRYYLRPNRTLNYSHKFRPLSVHARVKKWGEKAKGAIKEELNMLKKENVFEEVKNPSEDQKKKALMIYCFAVEKRDGRIKARALADGRSQM